MLKRLTVFVVSVLLLLNIYGCFALFAGAAGGTGTAVWLSGKLTEQFNAPYDRTIDAARQALRSLNLEVVKETRDDNVAQLRSIYTDGKEIWVDVRRVASNSTKVEVRVGAVNPDKEAADKILKSIQSHL